MAALTDLTDLATLDADTNAFYNYGLTENKYIRCYYATPPESNVNWLQRLIFFNVPILLCIDPWNMYELVDGVPTKKAGGTTATTLDQPGCVAVPAYTPIPVTDGFVFKIIGADSVDPIPFYLFNNDLENYAIFGHIIPPSTVFNTKEVSAE